LRWTSAINGHIDDSTRHDSQDTHAWEIPSRTWEC
jgi:hypothetical protein